MDLSDRFAIMDVLHLYAYLVDNKRWGDLRDVFAEQARLEIRPIDWVMNGVDEIADGYGHGAHPIGHHMTNTILSDGETPSAATAITKYITVREDGSAGCGHYEDQLVRTPDGWRIASRVAIHRGRVPSMTTLSDEV